MTLSRPIRFIHRGAVTEVRPESPTRTVLEWLREDARRTGTKEGCAEGDCGACTVVVGSLRADGSVALDPVNACIRLLPTLDGRALFTVEDVGRPGALHPVQQALVDHHGSQCGFCTPGIVMSLWACYQQHALAGTPPSRAELAEALSGNLCRCTGYRPILDAGQHMFDAPAALLDRAALAVQLRALRSDAPLSWPGRWHAPRKADALAALRLARPQARLLAGGTDVGVWVAKQLRDPGELIWLGDVADLQSVNTDAARIAIGAAVPLEAAWRALAAEWPELRELGLRFASPPIRAAGTLVGNLANGSPIGDAAPALVALGASLLLRRGDRRRRLALDAFYLDYMRNALEEGEFVESVELPRRTAGQRFRAYKISKRRDSDISAVCLAAAIELDAGGRVATARIACGGMAATVRRAPQAEAAMLGRPWDEAAVAAAAQAGLAADFQPLTDLRASAGYRMQVAQNLLTRLWLETRGEARLPPEQTGVWALGATVEPAR